MGYLKHTISCLVCGKEKTTHQTGTIYCSSACRQKAYRKSLKEDVTALRHAVTSYRELLYKVAKELGKDDNWIKRKIRAHEAMLIDDAHHGYNEEEAIWSLKNSINVQVNNNSK